MKSVKLFKKSDIERYISKRKGEQKFGELLHFPETIETLEKESSKFAIFGIPEDIGIRANHGQPGAANTWEHFVKAFVNIQVNRYNDPGKVTLLGNIDCSEEMKKASYLEEADPNYYQKLGDLVKLIDQKVSDLVEKLILCGKIPIIIGGGHNNAYGNIKGAAKALNKSINVLNIDAHTDLRQLEHRHSGNGFSYAIAGEYLRKYTVFGLHKNYTPEYIFREMDASENLEYVLAEDLLKFREEITRKFEVKLSEISTDTFGLELDCDAIADFPSSAKSPSGFSVDQIRNFIQLASKQQNCGYFHICEAAATEGNAAQVGKALSYFVSDFIAQESSSS